MFGFNPKLPVSEKAQGWIDISMAELLILFGHEALDQATTILPTGDFFPDAWDGSEDSIEGILCRVCGYMGVDRNRLRLEVHHEEDTGLRDLLPNWRESSQGAAGTYRPGAEGEKLTICVKNGRRSDFISITATIAHELGHVLLLGDGKIERDRPDMEPLTDLATVFWGMGIFTANTVLRFSQYHDDQKHGWSISRQGYLSEQMFAYALARRAKMCGEKNPSWAKYLNVNVRTYLKQSLKCLARETS